MGSCRHGGEQNTLFAETGLLSHEENRDRWRDKRALLHMGMTTTNGTDSASSERKLKARGTRWVPWITKAEREKEIRSEGTGVS